MKQIIKMAAGCLMLAALITGCKKDEPVTGTDASIANVSFTNVNSSAKVVNFYVNSILVSVPIYVPPVANAVATTTILGTYAGVTPGRQVVTVRDSSGAAPIYYSDFQRAVEGGKSYSFILYDTFVPPANQLKGILLNTDRTPDANPLNAKVRFLNFSPKSPAFDVVMVRQTSNGSALAPKDSVTLGTGVGYIGATTPNINVLSAFVPLLGNQSANTGAGNLATNYILKLKAAGSSTVLGSFTLSLIPTKNYTLMLRGIYPSATLISLTNN